MRSYNLWLGLSFLFTLLAQSCDQLATKPVNISSLDGCRSGNCHNGTGEVHYSTGKVYQGQFKNGRMHGKGFMRMDNGDAYDGQWVNDKKEGFGYYESEANGWNYKGQWLDNRFHGTGVYKTDEGLIYEGNFKDDAYSGYGEIVYPYPEDGDEGSYLAYYGEWEEDEHVGWGFVMYRDSTFEGGIWAGSAELDSSKTMEEVVAYLNTMYDTDWSLTDPE